MQWSGIDAFPSTLDRGAGGYWRTYQAQQLATPESFQANPSLVWEFYSYRREVMHTKVRYMCTQKLDSKCNGHVPCHPP